MGSAKAADITVLSAGAVEPGLTKVIAAFRRETGRTVKVAFATAPAILKRIGGGETADVVIAPPAVLDEIVKAGKATPAERVTVGRVGIGMAVRAGAPAPKIATVDEFKQSLLNAESVVYNQASTGIYLERLFDRLGMAERIKVKTTRYPDFAAVRDHMTRSRRNEVGLGATTVIVEAADKGLKLVGPLPAEIQNYTAYAATVASQASANRAETEFIRYLTTPAAKAILAAAGIE
ncbi:MAG TPA: substrate-binding domain-containing protein [Candidatus Binatia bacterium]